jgi:hypothetical protein
MPAILDRLVKQLRDKGKSPKAARAIAVSALQKSGNLKKTPGQRAIDRAAKRSGRKITDYTYNSKTNRATIKRTAKKRRKKK